MIFTSIKDLKYVVENKSYIDLLATCKEYGEIPMTLNLADTEDLHTYATGTFDENQNEILIPLEEYCKILDIAPYVKPEPIIIVPNSITMRQARLYLLSLGLLDEVEGIVSQDRAWQIEWEYTSEVLRTNQLISVMQVSLNLTNEQIGNMFIEASKL